MNRLLCIEFLNNEYNEEKWLLKYIAIIKLLKTCKIITIKDKTYVLKLSYVYNTLMSIKHALTL